MSYFRSVLCALKRFLLRLLPLAGAYFLLDLFAVCLIRPEETVGLCFTAVWSLLLASVALLFNRQGGRIFFGITYSLMLAWSMAQSGYHAVFDKMMWLKDILYIGEGFGFLGDTLRAFSPLWWIGGILLIVLGVMIIRRFPEPGREMITRAPLLVVIACMVAMLILLPGIIFMRDANIFGTRSEYGQSSSYRATYETMYDAQRTYEVCGLYQLVMRDVWVHGIVPKTFAYTNSMDEQIEKVKLFFNKRGKQEDNGMTGVFEGKNVVLVLMESMDDWLITPEQTPTIYKLMDEGINFTSFYTPGYGTARTLNTEFCINTGIYLPTTGEYVFNYMTNAFRESLAARATQSGYTTEVFHYNTPEFYSRGVMEPALGYRAYNCYDDYLTDEEKALLFDDCTLFDVQPLRELFFREGKTLNTIITRSAHLGYTYNEVLSRYAFSKYPDYEGMFGSEEEDCIRVKAKLVDDLFARLLQELRESGQLDNTVIIGVTDHYAYGMKNTEELLRLSGVEEMLMLERTPFFIWSAEGPNLTVDKTLNTSDFLPTVLNLLGIDSPYSYLGRDAFDPNYSGYALFPDGSWISDGVACRVSVSGKAEIIYNLSDRELTEEDLAEMAQYVQQYIHVNNLLLTSDYYAKSR